MQILNTLCETSREVGGSEKATSFEIRMCLHQGTSIGAQRVTEGAVVGDEDPGGHFKGRDKDSPEIVDILDCCSGEKEAERKRCRAVGICSFK